MSSNTDLTNSITEMGFPEFKAKKAIKATKAAGLDQALEWLIDNADRIEEGGEESAEEDSFDKNPRSFKCDECGKQLRDSPAVEFHSAKTGHVQFSESTDEIKPLSSEERNAQMVKLQEIMEQKKKERLEQERKDELEQEKRRREMGKEISTAKEDFQHIEMKHFIEEQKRQKEEDKRYKEELKAQIARERKEKLAREQEIQQPKLPMLPNEPKMVKTDECKLQVRTPHGPLIQTFKSCETLSAVRVYVSTHWPGLNPPADYTRVALSTTFPKKDFAEEQMSSTLMDLNLCPASALMARLV